mmetsp:Transcript_33528/g.107104  ORF Transcript_33528/g.107104 Transcript_33528/m.107104 type:complete len:235 (-) Transcript_33528:3414-4118(-)
MSRFSAAWLRHYDPEDPAYDDAEGGEEEEDWLLPLWNAVDKVDERIGSAEDQVARSFAAVAPFLKRRSEDVASSAAATVEASKRLRTFLAWQGVSCFFFGLAMFVGLPVVVVRPQKFAFSFTLGSLAFMASFAALRGTKAHLRLLFQRDRAVFTAAYVTTMLATLHAAVIRRSFLLTVIASTAQFTTLLYYLGSFLPGGYKGVRLFLAAAGRTLRLVLRPILAACFNCCVRLVQ